MNPEKWRRLSLAQQLGNIGSEFSRYQTFLKKAETQTAYKSLEEVLNLLDLTISDKRWLGRAKELVRLREVIGDFFNKEPTYQVTSESLQNYFLAFAVVARLQI